ncbi:MAG: Fis family transcriptional regulator [Archangium gephyra]|uniref:Fis family transcriptional regulator n=1 Tax=Archangium gephyra TaxID=48 RepID=A0A2W5TVF9_9BACT|nr:MAG: Fis family transcriptional regulator [Archangium gephyra]
MARILVIDDNDTMREGMAVTLKKAGHEVLAFRNGTDGLTAFKSRGADLIVTDLKMDGLNGHDVVREAKAHDPNVVLIMVSGHGNIPEAVQAMQLGASNFMEKGFTPDELRAKVTAALELAAVKARVQKLEATTEALSKDLSQRSGVTLVGDSAPVQKLLAQVKRAAATDATVLVHGESGTGKELIARMLHDMSPRAAGPFIVTHCAALAETLLESELFGHERGAFTGAVKKKLGRFELADEGTIFLDEIGEISASVQTKLLRVLQEREIQRVGGEGTKKVNVRVICATHRDLKAEVAAGRFREDLYYRLHVVPLELPALRERPEDIGTLARHFVAKHAPRINVRVKTLSASAISALCRYAWPGNVRELENAIEQSLVFAEGIELDERDLPAFLQSATARASHVEGALPVPHGDRPLPDILEDLERQLIERAYEKAKKVKTETARLLGIKTSALYYKLEKYGFIQKGERPPDEA